MLTDAWFKLRYHPIQHALWNDPHQTKVIQAGRGSGKTEIARRYTVGWLGVEKPWNDPMYFYALPTYGWAKRVAWEPLQALVPRSWYARHNPISASDLCIKTCFGSRLFLLGMDKPSRAEGVQWDGGCLDESSDQRPKVVDLSLGPAMTHRDPWLWRLGVPKRYGQGAPEFNAAFDLADSGDEPNMKAYHWMSRDILTPEQLADRQRSLDKRDFREQYEASREQAGGLIFHAFGKHNIDQNVKYDPDKPLIVGSDFNVDPMSWAVCQEWKNELHQIDEIFIRNTNTPATLDELADRYTDKHRANYLFYGDASGKARKTSAAADVTDYKLILKDERFKPKRVLYPKSNPSKKSRFAGCNALFMNAADEVRYKVHPKCKHTIQDLKERAYKEGTMQSNDSGDVSHCSDALGYIIYPRYPILAKKKKPGTVRTMA